MIQDKREINKQNNFSKIKFQLPNKRITLQQIIQKSSKHSIQRQTISKMQSEIVSQKKREYENKILQFMTKTQQSVHTQKQQQTTHKESNKIQKLTTHKSTQQSMHYNESRASIKKQQQQKSKRQQQSKNSSTYQSKTLNRKTSLLSLNSPHPQQQQIPYGPNHKNLLQKIQSRISQMNQKISLQISNEQNTMMNEYQQKLKSKQEELNLLRQVTNPQMIIEKTVQRKEQLKREKENLIQGNHYYSLKLQQLKKEFSRLVDVRDSKRKNLHVLMLDQPLSAGFIKQPKHQLKSLENSQIHTSLNSQLQTSQVSRRSKKKPVYFSSEDYVQKVLRKYNQKSQMISESRLQQQTLQQQSQHDLHTQQIRKHQSLLPRIVQNNKSLRTSKSINPQYEGQQFYSYRKIRNKFDRAKSTGVFDSVDVSMESRVQEIGNMGELVGNKLSKFFRYNNNNKSNSHHIKQTKTTKDITDNPSNDNQKVPQRVKKISNTSQIVIPNKQPQNKLEYTKEQLQQFVVKKTTKQQIPKTNKQKPSMKLQDLLQKEKLMKQQLQPSLNIESLFRSAGEQYYKFKYKQNSKLNTQQQLHNQLRLQQQQIQQSSVITSTKPYINNSQLTQAQKKKSQSLIEMKQFDKKIIMDLLLNHYNFKRYLYDLIVNEFQPKNHFTHEFNFQKVVKNFDNSTMFADSRKD